MIISLQLQLVIFWTCLCRKIQENNRQEGQEARHIMLSSGEFSLFLEMLD